MDERNQICITSVCAAVCQLMGFAAPAEADDANPAVMRKAEKIFAGRQAERILLYNPDAIALWLYQKYTDRFIPVIENSDIAIPMLSVMPSVTPVCFASMYTGLQPQRHGIQAYVKPVLKVETLFDAAIKAGKKPVIISTRGDSITEIFKERDMTYIECDTPDECNEKTEEILKQDLYDIVVCYNANFDSTMHRWGPEAEESLAQIDHNARAYHHLSSLADEVWKDKDHVCAFLPDHGCHEIDGNLGSHGLDMREDMNIIHFWSLVPKKG